MLGISANVLIVDDMESVCELLRTMFNSLGYMKVSTVQNAEEAKSFLNESVTVGPKVNLVVTDIHMDGDSGIMLLEWIRTSEVLKTIPVILVTSTPEITHVMSAAQHGVRSFLVKPFSTEDLKAKLAKI